MTCQGCKKTITEAGFAYNFGGKPVYWCESCKPPVSEKDIIESIRMFVEEVTP